MTHKRVPASPLLSVSVRFIVVVGRGPTDPPIPVCELMAASAAEILQLRTELEQRFGGVIRPAAAPERERFEGFRTGVEALDAALPRGVERGTLSVWTGEATSGLTAAVRALVNRACGEGARVAVVDGTRTLDATFGCTDRGPLAGLWMVRPPDAGGVADVAWAAESLLRSGVFDLVVLDGGALDDGAAHRLRALARERNAAVLVTSGAGEQETGNGAVPTPARRGERRPSFPVPRQGAGQGEGDARSLPFRADARLEFRRVREAGAGPGLERGGRYRRRSRVVVAKRTGAPGSGAREMELTHEPEDRLRTHRVAPDRSPGGR
jgi:hypothetical protein